MISLISLLLVLSVFSWSILYRNGNNVDISLLKGDSVHVSLLLRLDTRDARDDSLQERAPRAQRLRKVQDRRLPHHVS